MNRLTTSERIFWAAAAVAAAWMIVGTFMRWSAPERVQETRTSQSQAREAERLFLSPSGTALTQREVEERYQKGVVTLEKGDAVTAIEILSAIPESHPRSADARQRIERAKPQVVPQVMRQLELAEKAFAKGRVDEAHDILQPIPQHMLPPDARRRHDRLLDKISQRRAAAAERDRQMDRVSGRAAAAAAAERDLQFLNRAIREALAEEIERIFLKWGWDVYITLEGREKTTMRMKYVLWSRPSVHRFTSDADLMERFQGAGFRRLVFDDGYGRRWTLDLQSMEWR